MCVSDVHLDGGRRGLEISIKAGGDGRGGFASEGELGSSGATEHGPIGAAAAARSGDKVQDEGLDEEGQGFRTRVWCFFFLNRKNSVVFFSCFFELFFLFKFM